MLGKPRPSSVLWAPEPPQPYQDGGTVIRTRHKHPEPGGQSQAGQRGGGALGEAGRKPSPEQQRKGLRGILKGE